MRPVPGFTIRSSAGFKLPYNGLTGLVITPPRVDEVMTDPDLTNPITIQYCELVKIENGIEQIRQFPHKKEMV